MSECICQICNEMFEEYLFLSHHIRSVHKISREDYYDKFLIKEGETNLCICGNKKKIKSISRGYNSYCSKECQYKEQRIGGASYSTKRKGQKAWNKGISTGKGRVSQKLGRRDSLTEQQKKNLSEGIKAGLKKSLKNKERLERGDHNSGRCKIFLLMGIIYKVDMNYISF